MLRLSPAALLAATLFSVSLFAQAPVGTISGTITDPAGAVVPNATITVTNKATSTARTLTSNNDGLYNAPALPPGDYAVRVEAQGFRTVVRDANVVAGGNTTVDAPLSVGETREVVTVEAASAAVNYESQSVAGVIPRESIQDIPLNGRNSLQLAALEPGVTVAPGATSQFNQMFNVSILGANGGATSGGGVGPAITMDGGTINDEVEGGTSMNFSQEVVQEFQLSSVNFDPSTGIAAGGGVNIVTRSGSNEFHGSAYFFFRDHNMAAYPGLKRNPFNPNPFFARRNPGVWLGGPIIKDKLFTFTSYEYMNQTSVITETNDIASLQPLNGIWPSPLHYNWLTQRFDYHINDKNNLFLRYSHDSNADFGPYAGTGAPSAWIHNQNWSDQIITGVTTIFSSSLVNDMRAQYHYWENKGPNATAADCNLPCVGAGLPGITTMVGSATFTYGAGNEVNGPQFHASRSWEINDTLSWQKGSHRLRFGMDIEQMRTAYKPWDVCDPACIGLYSVEQTNALSAAFPAGAFATLPTAIHTTNDLLNLPISTSAAALYSGVAIGNGSWPGTYDHNQGGVNTRSHPWVSDAWKVRPDLTVNLGLSYAYESGLFSPFLTRPQFLAPILNGQTGGVPSGLGATPSNKLDFAPQLGFAWALGKEKRTVIRGGASMFWDTNPVWQQFREDASIGPAGDGRVTVAGSAFTNIFPNIYERLSSGTVVPLPAGSALPLTSVNFTNLTLGQFLQIMSLQVPVLQSQIFSNPVTSGPYSTSGIQITKQGVEIYPAQFPLIRSYQTSIGVQHDFGHNFVLTADWARRQGENLNLSEQDLNRSQRESGPVIPKCATTPDFNPNDECSTGGITFWVPEGRSVYEGLLVKMQKRFSKAHGIAYQFQAAYALQRLMYESAAVNLNNYFASYGPQIPRQNFNLAGVANLPWGFTLSLNSSIITANPATPIIPGIDLNGAGNASSYPITEAVAGLSNNGGVSYGCFAFSCSNSQLVSAVNAYNANVAGTKGANGVAAPKLTLPANFTLGKPIITQDMRITKELTLKEKYKFQVFGEFFNVLNVANLTFSGTPVLTSATFGQATGRVAQSSTFGQGGPRAIQVGGRFTF